MSYTPEQLLRRQTSRWTIVQAITAPVQFLAFLVSVVLVVRYLMYGDGYIAAHAASLVKVALMIFITVTGMLWEKDMYGNTFWLRSFSGKTWSTAFHCSFIWRFSVRGWAAHRSASHHRPHRGRKRPSWFPP